MSRFVVRICPNYLYNYRQTPEPSWILKKTETPTYFYEANSLQNMTVYETRKKNNPREFRMDNIIDMNVSSATVFENELSPLIEKYVMKGLDITVLVVGSPLSGQRYTLEGPPKHGGLLFHSIDKIFSLLSQEENENQGIQFSCCHIDKKENITDALNPQSSTSQRIYYKEDPKKGVYISGLTKTRISHPQEVLNLFQHNKFRFGQMNVHTVFTLQVDQRIRKMVRPAPDQPYYSKLVEKHGRVHFFCLSLPKDMRGYISSQPYWNRCFNDVFDQIDHGDPVVHFRKSKVTSFLKDSLLGYKPTLLFVNLSPQFESYRECVWALRFTSKIHQVALKNSKLRRREKSASSSRRTSSSSVRGQGRPYPRRGGGGDAVSDVSATSSQANVPKYYETFSSKQKKSKSPSKRRQQPPEVEQQQESDEDYPDEEYDRRQDDEPYRNRRGYTDTEIQRRERTMNDQQYHEKQQSPPRKKKRGREPGPPKGGKGGKGRSGHPKKGGKSSKEEPPQSKKKKKKKKKVKKKRVSTNDRYRDEEMYTHIMESRIKKIKDQCYNIESEKEELKKKYQVCQKRKRKLERELFHVKKDFAEKHSELDQINADMKLELERVKAANRKMKRKLEDKTRIIEDKEGQILQLSSNIDRTIGVGGGKKGKDGLPIPSNLMDGGGAGQTAILKEDEIIVSEKQFRQYEKYIQDAMQLNESLRTELETSQAEHEKTREELEHARHAMETRETEIVRLNNELGMSGEREDELKLLRLKNSILKKALAESLKKLTVRNLRESGYDLNPEEELDDVDEDEDNDEDTVNFGRGELTHDDDDVMIGGDTLGSFKTKKKMKSLLKEKKQKKMTQKKKKTPPMERKRRIRELEEPTPMNDDDDDEESGEEEEEIDDGAIEGRSDDEDEEEEEDDDVPGKLGESFMKGIGDLVGKYKQQQQQQQRKDDDDDDDEMFVSHRQLMHQRYGGGREQHGEDTDDEMLEEEEGGDDEED